MPANKRDDPHWSDPGNARDLWFHEWQTKVAPTRFQQTRSKPSVPKVPTTIQFDIDILRQFKAAGRGWQSGVNYALREWLTNHRRKGR